MTDTPKKQLETTRYLQFQLSNINDEVESTEEDVAVMISNRKFGSRLTGLKYRLEYLKGKRDTLQQIWNMRKEGKLFI